MNFLSHFYFDRHSNDPNLVLGTVLPDLVKNARKDWKLHPNKKPDLFKTVIQKSILRGWNRHLAVDRYFHNSGFFIKHTGAIRIAIAPILKNSVVRPSFIAHISLELMLDSILLRENMIAANDLYQNLHKSDRKELQYFLELNRIDDTAHFFKFYDQFLAAKYLDNYREIMNIMYALNRICMRIWPDPLNETQIRQLSPLIANYHESLLTNYMEIYNEIELRMN